MTWFTYEIPPIDNHWELLRTVAEVAQQLAVREAEFIVKEGRDSAVALPITLDEFSKLRMLLLLPAGRGALEKSPVYSSFQTSVTSS